MLSGRRPCVDAYRPHRRDYAGKQKETITIRDHTYDLTHYGSEFDGAKIVEVR